MSNADIKMIEKIKPFGATHWLGEVFARWDDNNTISVISTYQGATWERTNRGMPRNAIDLSDITLINTHNAMQARISELKAALEGLCCSPHTRLTKHVLLEVSEADINAAIKALKDNS